MGRAQRLTGSDSFEAVFGGGRGLSAAQAHLRVRAQQAAEAEVERARKARLADEAPRYCEDCGTLCSQTITQVENPDWDERLRSADGHDIPEFVDVAPDCCPNPDCESFAQ